MLKIPDTARFGLELEREAKEVLRTILASIPGSQIEFRDELNHSSDGRRGDFEVTLKTSAGSTVLFCETKSRAWPNELYSLAHRMKGDRDRVGSAQTIPVLIAPYVSKQAAETCLELGLSWADLAGNCELQIEGAFIKIQGRPNPYRQGRGTASLYTPKSANVVHALLLDPHRPWTTEELAQTAKVSLGLVSSVKKLLEAQRWIQSSYGKTVLSEPNKLLEDWGNHYKPKRKALRCFTLDSPSQFESRVAEALQDYAFTEFSAAERFAPYTRHQQIAFYAPRWDGELSKALGLKQGDGASNVTIYTLGEPILFAETVNGVRCASPIQTYLDLKELPGRGQDAASHLHESVIQARWV